jgi:hypothetical protein
MIPHLMKNISALVSTFLPRLKIINGHLWAYHLIDAINILDRFHRTATIISK